MFKLNTFYLLLFHYFIYFQISFFITFNILSKAKRAIKALAFIAIQFFFNFKIMFGKIRIYVWNILDYNIHLSCNFVRYTLQA
jgi:hypothetical protein